MDWNTIKNCGKIAVGKKNIPLTTGKNVTADFFYGTMYEFAKVSCRLFEIYSDLPYAYKEKQLSSILLPAYYNLGFGALQEHPTKRNIKHKKQSFGWLDYWVQKGDHWVYLVEVKHAWQKIGNSLSNNAVKEFSYSISQLENIKKKEVENLSSVETTYKISFIVLPIWKNIIDNVKIGEVCPTSTLELEKTSKIIIDENKLDSSWLGVWSVPDHMQFAYQSGNKKTLETIPGVMFIFKVINN